MSERACPETQTTERWVLKRSKKDNCHSASLCLLVGAFNPFTFKVIIDKYDPVAIYFVVVVVVVLGGGVVSSL